MTLRRLLLLFAWVGASLLMQAATAQKPSELHAVVKTRGSKKPIQKSRDDRATSIESQQADEKPLDGRDGGDLSVHLYNPKSQLKTKVTDVKHAAFPAVNVHTHFFYRLRLNRDALEDFVGAMDRNHIAVCVSLDGKLGTQFQEQKDYQVFFHHELVYKTLLLYQHLSMF